MISYYPIHFETSYVRVSVVDAKVARVSMKLGIYDDSARSLKQAETPCTHRSAQGFFEVEFDPTGKVIKTHWAVENPYAAKLFGEVIIDAATQFATDHAKEAWRGTNGDYADYRGPDGSLAPELRGPSCRQ